jgi:hypothetical protein
LGAKTLTSVTGGANNAYSVTPSFGYKGILGAADKLVVYYMTGSSPSQGPYAAALSFTKAELEAATVTPKTLTIFKATSAYNSAYVQAWLEFADGTKENVSSIYGDGVTSDSSYQGPGDEWVNCKLLDY